MDANPFVFREGNVNEEEILKGYKVCNEIPFGISEIAERFGVAVRLLVSPEWEFAFHCTGCDENIDLFMEAVGKLDG